jgi:hypothetical protein
MMIVIIVVLIFGNNKDFFHSMFGCQQEKILGSVVTVGINENVNEYKMIALKDLFIYRGLITTSVPPPLPQI